ncbi:MAG: hypothetical protein Q8P75_01960 [bacterium]|nr:hypothetical protein [bacterium]
MEQKINPIQNPSPVNPQPPHKHLHPGIWITVLIVAALSVGYLVWANASKEWPFEENLQSNNSVTQQPTADQTNNTGNTSNDLTLKDWEVKAISLGNDGSKKLILTNRVNGSQKTLIDNTDTLRKRIVQEFDVDKIFDNYGVINLTGSPSIGTAIYFELVYEYGGPVFAMDINSMKLRQSKYGSMRLLFAPTGVKAVIAGSVGQERFNTTLSLVCLNNDTERQLIALTNSEVFNEYPPELDQNVHIKWNDENKVEYSVYRIAPNQKPDTYLQNTFLKSETLNVPGC